LRHFGKTEGYQMRTDKRTIDIETALQWTMRDEMPKGRPVEASVWDTVISYSRLGARVDVSHGGGGGLGFIDGEPHPDAVTIARAVGDLPSGMSLSADECEALVGHYARLDRAAVSAVARASFNPVMLIIGCAGNRARPAWDIGLPRVRVLRHSNNNAIVFGDDDAGGVMRLRPAKDNSYRFADRPRAFIQYCEPSVGELIEARVEYTIWHRALALLVTKLAGKLADHVVTGPKASAAPWSSGEAPAVVHVAADAPTMVRLPLKPARGRTPRPHESEIERQARESRTAARAGRKGRKAAEGEIALSGGRF
jgi:hypothetical protein